ncbi:MAG: threonine synthase [Cyclobacteriaceae bacterium]|nr:threonine synthase [Cyclobacteriaceae bacterium]
MHYYSTNNKQHKVSLGEAVLEGLAPDSGLYMPESIQRLPKLFFDSLSEKTFQQIGFEVAKNLMGNDIPEEELTRIIEYTIQFDAPLVEVENDVYSLELFHGPTLAFKDFGARFLSGLLGYFARLNKKDITILVATSGDTGSAVANAFLNVVGTRVIVLYPSGKVSEAQEKQFTTLGANITSLEVSGTFDDCQRLVKQSFLDVDLKNLLSLTSANSINIARLIPQTFYYFQACAQVKQKDKPIVISVPSGNFGNLTAGLMSKRMGLPIESFVASTNVNDVVPEFLRTQIFTPRNSKQTISNAMDVGNPSNFARLLDLYDNDFQKLSNEIMGCRFSDDATRAAMRKVFSNFSYTLDPHGAVGYLGLKEFLKDHANHTGIFLETAHPAKFIETVEAAINHKVEVPARLETFMKGEKKSIPVSSNFAELKKLLPTLIAQ